LEFPLAAASFVSRRRKRERESLGWYKWESGARIILYQKKWEWTLFIKEEERITERSKRGSYGTSKDISLDARALCVQNS
jgi:hypothetical protein